MSSRYIRHILFSKRVAAFAPSDVPGLVAWYDDSSLTADTAIPSWTARSGASAPAMSQGTAGSQPNDRGTIFEANGRRGAFFDGGDALVGATHGPFDYAHDIGGCTIIVVFVTRSNGSGQTLIGTRNYLTSTDGRGLWLYYDGPGSSTALGNVGAFVSRGAPGSGTSVGGVISTGTVKHGVNIAVFRIKPSTLQVSVSVNGSAESVVTWNTPDARGTASVFSPTLGSDAKVLGLSTATADIPSILIYDRDVGNTDVARLLSYLSSTYEPPTVTTETAMPSAVSTLARPVKVMATGDSITQGYNAPGNVGYSAIAESLGAGSWDFIGPVTLGGVDTNGRSGWVIRKFASADGHSPRGGNANAIDTVLGTYSPDVILYMIGTNAVSTGWSRNHLRDLYELITDAYAIRPHRVILATLLRRAAAGQHAAYVRIFNSGVAAVARALRAQGIPVLVRDWWALYSDTEMTTAPGDGLHPGDHTKMGQDAHSALSVLCG